MSRDLYFHNLAKRSLGHGGTGDRIVRIVGYQVLSIRLEEIVRCRFIHEPPAVGHLNQCWVAVGNSCSEPAFAKSCFHLNPVPIIDSSLRGGSGANLRNGVGLVFPQRLGVTVPRMLKPQHAQPR